MEQYIRQISGLQYFVCMIDYGGRLGMGADVAPEYTRRQIIDTVRDAIARGDRIVHVKHINGNDMQDVTDEILREALQEREPASWPEIGDKLAALQDHARKLRAETV